MATLWVYRLFLAIAVPTLVLLTMAVASQLPQAIATGDADLPGLLAWAAAGVLGVLLLIAGSVLRRRGRLGLATTLVGIVAMPAAAGIGAALFIVLLFILKG